MLSRPPISPRPKSAYIGGPAGAPNCPNWFCLKTRMGLIIPLGKSPARVHQVLRLPDERLRFRAHGRSRRRGRLSRGRAASRTPTSIVLNTCHIRERASEKIYSELGKLRELKEERSAGGPADDARGRRLRRPGRGRRNPAPPAGRRYRGRPAELSPPAGAACARRASAPASSTPNFRPRTNSRICLPAPRRCDPQPRRHGFRHRAGGLRQVLLVLRRALHARRRGLAPGRRDPRGDRAPRRRGRARGDAARAERQRLSRARTNRAGDRVLPDLIGAVAAVPGIVRRALHDLASQRHERGSHRRPSRCAGARALSPSARPVRLGPDAEVDEPPPSRRRLSRHCRSRARRAPGHRALLGFHRWLSRRNRRRFRRDARAGPRRSASPRPTPSNIPPGPERRPRKCATRSTRRPKPTVWPRFRSCIEDQRQAFNRQAVGRRVEVLFEKPGRREGQLIGRTPYMQSVFAEGPQSLIGQLAEVEILDAGAAFVAGTRLSRQRREIEVILA